ncbi:MAG: hypothetical protein ACPHN3_07885 [Spongiibacter sp.]
MGSKSRSSTSSTNTTVTETVNAALQDEATYANESVQARDSGIAVNTALNLTGSNNTITQSTTDHGAIREALKAADSVTSRAIDSVDRNSERAFESAEFLSEQAAAQQGRLFNSTRDILDDQVGAIQQLAESLKIGDENTAKLISIALIAGLVIVAALYIYKG